MPSLARKAISDTTQLTDGLQTHKKRQRKSKKTRNY